MMKTIVPLGNQKTQCISTTEEELLQYANFGHVRYFIYWVEHEKVLLGLLEFCTFGTKIQAMIPEYRVSH